MSVNANLEEKYGWPGETSYLYFHLRPKNFSLFNNNMNRIPEEIMFKAKKYSFIGLCVALMMIGLSSISYGHGYRSEGENVSSAIAWQQGYTLILMRNTDISSANQARDYVINQGGKIAVLSPPHVMLGWMPPGISTELIGKYGIELITQSPIDLESLEYRDEQTLSTISFFNSVSSGALAQEFSVSTTVTGEPLINDALEHPIINYNDYLKNLESLGISPSPRNSDSMTGTVTVALFFVESNGSIDANRYTWNTADQQNTVNRALNGLSWWANQAPLYGVGLTFTVYVYLPTTFITQQGYEPILHSSSDDGLWINQIMSNLGFTSGTKSDRVTAFNTALKRSFGTNWAYSVFIGYNPSPAPNRFTNGYFAYAYRGGPYLQMLFRNNGWGERNFGLVLTHETGHIFWACDEYFQAGYGGCTSCGPCDSSGPRPTINNGNCENCNPNAVACMMRSNSYALCSFTPLQIGWAGTIQFSSAYYSVNENGGSVLITGTRTGGSSGAVGVSYATIGFNAVANSDYTTTNGTLSWANGDMASKTFSVPITNDTLDEPNEYFIVKLSNPTGGATLGILSGAAVMITDDDPAPTVQFSAASSSESEATSPASITVTLSATSGQTVTVNYATADGTATTGSDYTAASGTLTFNPGVTSQTINVPIINDTAVEGNEWFTVTLSGPVNATLGSTTTHTYTINDDDNAGTIQFSSATYSVNENGVSVLITLTRTGGSSGAVGVSYATIDFDAVADSDYTATSGTLSWANGDTASKTFSISILNDSNYEGNETVNLTLSNPTGGATLSSPSTAVLTILDNDLQQPFPFSDDFSTDKGWAIYEPGGWERGPTVAGGGENGNPDPATDHSATTDNYILGFAIGEDYPNDLVEKSIISPPIDCTGQSRVFLKFWRYLNVQNSYSDHAKVYVSTDGANWTQLWENPVFDLTDNQWAQVVYDISSIAANQPTVYIEFTMGPTDSTMPFSGWNIDDLEVTYDYSGPLAIYIPYADIPNPNIDENFIQQGFGIHHSGEVPSDLSSYSLLILHKYEASNQTTADRIKNFVQGGGGAIIMGGTPNLLAGNTDNLSYIMDWFGAGTYLNDGGYGIVTNSNPFGTDLLANDKVDYSTTDCHCAASVDNLDSDATLISNWTSYGYVHSFTHNFGQGRAFYYAGNPGYSEDPDPVLIENSLTLFEAGLLWVAPVTTPPDPTTLISPSGAIANTTPTYEWNAVPEARKYYLWVNDSTSNRIRQWYTAAEANCPSGTGTCSVIPATGLNPGASKWKILTWNPKGYGPFSSVMAFTIVTTPPGRATLVSPKGTITTTTPTYKWNAVLKTEKYYLWVNDSTGNRIMQWYTAAEANCPSGTGICSVTPMTVLNPGTCKWKIQTWNSIGYGPWSSTISFKVSP